MKDLRPLLIDCRIELRKHQRDFQKSQLCERLDLMLQAVTSADVSGSLNAASPSPATTPAATGAAPEKAQTVSQVALAWQTAARDLKFTDPAIYQRLSDKVMRLLGSKTLVDPSTEILQMQAEIGQLKQRADDAAGALQRAEMEHGTLLAALADAVPALAHGAGGDTLSVALAQIQQLVSQGPTPAHTTGSSEHRSQAPAEPSTPSPDILKAVASGTRRLSDDQRNWAVGEGMVLSGFQLTPVELVELGDQRLAQLILDKQAEAAAGH